MSMSRASAVAVTHGEALADSPSKSASARDSTLARYISMFRANPAASRSERRPANPDDFWWLDASFNASTATSTATVSSTSPSSTAAVSSRRIRRRRSSQQFEPYARATTARRRHSRSSDGPPVSDFGEGEEGEGGEEDDEEEEEEEHEVAEAEEKGEESKARVGNGESDGEDILARWRAKRRVMETATATTATAAIPSTLQPLLQLPESVAGADSHTAEIAQRLRLRLAKLGVVERRGGEGECAETATQTEPAVESRQFDTRATQTRKNKNNNNNNSSNNNNNNKSTQTCEQQTDHGNDAESYATGVTSLADSAESLVTQRLPANTKSVEAVEKDEEDEEGNDEILRRLLQQRESLTHRLAAVNDALNGIVNN